MSNKSNTDNRRQYSVHRNDKEFQETIDTLIKKYEIKEIVETGAFVGMGSTTVFGKTGLPVYSIECNKNHYEVAKHKTRFYPNVFIFHGLSLSKKELIKATIDDTFIDNPPEGVLTDAPYPKPYYLAELNKEVPMESILPLLITNNRSQLIYLDSAGSVGLQEYECVMTHCRMKNKVLVLDDVTHVKHYRSLQDLDRRGIPYTKSSCGKFAWCYLG